MESLADRQASEIVAALGMFPETAWDVNDDACDCVFQRIGFWTNPYIGETQEVRLCCIWEELYKLFPQHVRRTKAFYDYNANEWSPGPRQWNGEADMPPSIWYRHVANRDNITVAEARERYAHLSPPVGIPRPVVEVEEAPDPVAILFEMVTELAQRVAELEPRHGAD